MKNNFDLDDIREYVYKEDAKHFDTIPTRAVHQVVKVDYFVPGCPPPIFSDGSDSSPAKGSNPASPR